MSKSEREKYAGWKSMRAVDCKYKNKKKIKERSNLDLLF